MHECRNVSFVVLDLILMKKRKKMEPLKPQMEGSKKLSTFLRVLMFDISADWPQNAKICTRNH